MAIQMVSLMMVRQEGVFETYGGERHGANLGHAAFQQSRPRWRR